MPPIITHTLRGWLSTLVMVGIPCLSRLTKIMKTDDAVPLKAGDEAATRGLCHTGTSYHSRGLQPEIGLVWLLFHPPLPAAAGRRRRRRRC